MFMNRGYNGKPKSECGCGWSLNKEPRARQVQGGWADTPVGDSLRTSHLVCWKPNQSLEQSMEESSNNLRCRI